MSTELESVVTRDNEKNQRVLYLTSFYGGDKRGHCLQVTAATPFGAEYVQLTKDDAVKLIGIISECFGLNSTDAIAAAVAAEKERCATKAGGIWVLADIDGVLHDHIVTEPIAAAIRASNGAQEQEK